MLYKNRENILSLTKPSSSLIITIKRNNYISYADDKQVIWTLNFNSESDINEFVDILKEKCKCQINREKCEMKSSKESINAKSETSEETNSDTKSDCYQNCNTNIEAEPSVSSQNKSIGDSNEKSFKSDEKSRVSGVSSVPKNIDSDTSDSSEAVLSKKADILNRVAKMGKKIFEKETGDVTDSSDFDELSKSRSEHKLKKGKSSKHSFSERNVNHPVEVAHNPLNSSDESVTKIMVPYQEKKTMISTAISSDQLNMFFIGTFFIFTKISLTLYIIYCFTITVAYDAVTLKVKG